MNPKSLNKFT